MCCYNLSLDIVQGCLTFSLSFVLCRVHNFLLLILFALVPWELICVILSVVFRSCCFSSAKEGIVSGLLAAHAVLYCIKLLFHSSTDFLQLKKEIFVWCLHLGCLAWTLIV